MYCNIAVKVECSNESIIEKMIHILVQVLNIKLLPWKKKKKKHDLLYLNFLIYKFLYLQSAKELWETLNALFLMDIFHIFPFTYLKFFLECYYYRYLLVLLWTVRKLKFRVSHAVHQCVVWKVGIWMLISGVGYNIMSISSDYLLASRS